MKRVAECQSMEMRRILRIFFFGLSAAYTLLNSCLRTRLIAGVLNNAIASSHYQSGPPLIYYDG